jgi:hypothetical protein
MPRFALAEARLDFGVEFVGRERGHVCRHALLDDFLAQLVLDFAVVVRIDSARRLVRLGDGEPIGEFAARHEGVCVAVVVLRPQVRLDNRNERNDGCARLGEEESSEFVASNQFHGAFLSASQFCVESLVLLGFCFRR